MDMDQRTRMLGRGSGGRVIVLGDGTEIHADSANDDDDGDIDMEDRGESEEDKDLEEQVRKGQADAKEGSGSAGDRSSREETPGPVEAIKPGEGAAPKSPILPSKLSTAEEPKMTVPVDGVDNKAILDGSK